MTSWEIGNPISVIIVARDISSKCVAWATHWAERNLSVLGFKKHIDFAHHRRSKRLFSCYWPFSTVKSKNLGTLKTRENYYKLYTSDQSVSIRSVQIKVFQGAVSYQQQNPILSGKKRVVILYRDAFLLMECTTLLPPSWLNVSNKPVVWSNVILTEISAGMSIAFNRISE